MQETKSSAPRFPDAEYVGPHLVIDKTEWIPEARPESHRPEEERTAHADSYFRCIRCGAERLHKHEFPDECDVAKEVDVPKTDTRGEHPMNPLSVRSFRAISEYMSVIPEAPDLYTVVSESGREYVVDLRDEPACTCPDFAYRSGVDECKHILRSRLETGRANVDRIKGALALAAVDADEEAEKRERESTELRTRARRIRHAVDRLDELAEEA